MSAPTPLLSTKREGGVENLRTFKTAIENGKTQFFALVRVYPSRACSIFG
jgi:hypothetical protein